MRSPRPPLHTDCAHYHQPGDPCPPGRVKSCEHLIAEENCSDCAQPAAVEQQVEHPTHYGAVPGIECWDVVEHFSFLRGNAIKYLWRAGAKGDVVVDLRKAIQYIEREIEVLER